MALQIWLPLNENANNLGLANFQTAAADLTYNASGKVTSKCAYFNSSHINIPNTNLILTSTSHFSIAFWAKLSNTNGKYYTLFCDRDVVGAGISIFYNPTSGGFRFDTGSLQTWFPVNSSYDSWTHFCFTFDGNQKCLYINGVKNKSVNYTGQLTNIGNSILIGKEEIANPSHPILNSYLNDYRVYDHCLSANEIKVLSQGLVVHYKLTNFNNNIEYDCSGYGNNGTKIGAFNSNVETLRYNQSTMFDGTTTGIILPIKALMQSLLNDVCTFNFWVKETDMPNRSVYFGGYINSSSGNHFNIEQHSGKLRVYWKQSPDLQTTAVMTNNGWSMISIVINKMTGIKIYKDNDLIKEHSNSLITITDSFTSDIFYIGKDARNDATMFSGLMSDFRIYATALSAEDIKRLYQTPISLSKSGELNAYEYIEAAVSSFTKTGIAASDTLRDCDADGETPATKLQIFKDAIQSTDFIEW